MLRMRNPFLYDCWDELDEDSSVPSRERFGWVLRVRVS
jgi:hypothetical protein